MNYKQQKFAPKLVVQKREKNTTHKSILETEIGCFKKMFQRNFALLSNANEPLQQKTTIDPADSQQSQAGTLTYSATKEDVRVAQSELQNKMCSTVAQRKVFLGNNTDNLKGKSDDELFKLLSE